MTTHSQNSCLENPMDRGAWQATFHRVVVQTAGREPAPVRGQPHGGRQGGAGALCSPERRQQGDAVLRAQAWHPGSRGQRSRHMGGREGAQQDVK